MDLETENRIAAILMKEAVELRQQAEKEGVHAYLRKPHVRGRPNSRFLTATVLGVQQANRVVEVNEMWRVRQKELQLDNRLKGRSEDDSSTDGMYRDMNDSQRATSIKTSAGASHSSSKRAMQDCYSRVEDGLKDEDIEEFLQSRVKRGRGSVGSRMDETGPYLPPSPGSRAKHLANHDGGSSGVSEHHISLGPKKPSYLKSHASPQKEPVEGKWKEEKKVGSSKKHLRKHRSKDKSRDKKKKKKREEKRCRHRKDL